MSKLEEYSKATKESIKLAKNKLTNIELSLEHKKDKESPYEILEGNKIIAEFYKECEYIKRKDRTYLKCEGEKWKFPQSKEINYLYNNFPIADYNLGGLLDPTKLNFHLNWEWLMPIIVKIKRMQHDPKEMFMGTTFERKMEFGNVTELPIYTPIETVWKKVVKFIQWYNLQKK